MGLNFLNMHKYLKIQEHETYMDTLFQEEKKLKQVHLTLAQLKNWTHNILKNTRKLSKYRKYLMKCFLKQCNNNNKG